MESTDDLTQLYRDDQLDLLLMRRGTADATVSARGVWLRKGKRQTLLGWDELSSVTLRSHGALARVEVTRATGATHSVGPFAVHGGRQWLESAAGYAYTYGANPRDIDGDEGFVVWAPATVAA